MENNREREKLNTLLSKSKIYLRFSTSFIAISFPLISLSNLVSGQGILDFFIDIFSNIFLTFSILLFSISTFFSIYTFNGLNSLKMARENENTVKGILFNSKIISFSSRLNLVGFILMVLYIYLVTTKNIILIPFITGIIILSIKAFKTLKEYSFYSKGYKKLIIYIIVLVILIIFTTIFVVITTW